MEAEIIISLLTLIALETVLGIDNVIFISILANKLPVNQQKSQKNRFNSCRSDETWFITFD